MQGNNKVYKQEFFYIFRCKRNKYVGILALPTISLKCLDVTCLEANYLKLFRSFLLLEFSIFSPQLKGCNETDN